MNPNNQVHWNYSRTNASWIPGTSTTTTISSSPVTSIKRSLSESDDCDTYSEGSSKEQCSSTAPSESCQMLTRKKRRGIIEKKRRDRINTSLTELKRLVPSAYEKQGSAKLEKAEILQMTVDYLKILNAKGVNNLAHDSHKYAIDYHSIGFRECANEVSRYLVTMEGMDLQDPLRLRLISHLQCFAAQREIANKQNPLSSPSANPWSYNPTHQPVSQPYHHHTLATAPNLNQLPNPTNSTQVPSINVHDSGHNYLDISASCTFTLNAPDVLNKARHGQIPHNSVNNNNNNNTNNNNAYSFMLTPNLTPLTPVTTSSYSQHFNSYPNATNANSSANPNYSNQTTNAPQMKPYRPWGGTELAY